MPQLKHGYCNFRHIVAALHFNSNLHREIRTTPGIGNQVAVVYPKFKNGEATVRDVKVKAKFGKFFQLNCCILI